MNYYDRIFARIRRAFSRASFSISLANNTYKIPLFQPSSFGKTSYYDERWLFELLKLQMKMSRLDSVIDVGVNIGQTLLKIKSLNPAAKYIGFEPNPYCYGLVQNIIYSNQFAECTLIPCGLGENMELLKLRAVQKNDLFDSSASVVEGFRDLQHENYQFVTIFPLDNLINQFTIDKIDIIKIDIEGAELEALLGMERTLAKYRPLIILEVLPAYDKNNSFRINRQVKLAKFLDNCHYETYHIKKHKDKLSFNQVAEFPVHSNVDESDYILLPKDIKLEDIGLGQNINY